MKKIIIVFAFSPLLIGCYVDECTELRSINRMNLNKLALGMTKQDVMQLMGEASCEVYFINALGKRIFLSATNPYRNEILLSKEKTFEVLYYYTDKKRADDAITDDELTPLVFEESILIGWGQDFLKDKVQKYELRIR